MRMNHSLPAMPLAELPLVEDEAAPPSRSRVSQGAASRPGHDAE